MPKYSTFPTIIEHTKCISISNLKKEGFVKDGLNISGITKWSRNGEVTSSISFTFDWSLNPHMRLDYKQKGVSISYKVYLIEHSSNLGKGSYYYFLCPSTRKRCRKLYFSGKHFVHREALNAYYESQTVSNKTRIAYKIIDAVNNKEKAYEEMYAKGFTPFYKGKETKRYKRIVNTIENSNRYSLRDFEMAFIA